jgi:hypothetical protein
VNVAKDKRQALLELGAGCDHLGVG